MLEHRPGDKVWVPATVLEVTTKRTSRDAPPTSHVAVELPGGIRVVLTAANICNLGGQW